MDAVIIDVTRVEVNLRFRLGDFFKLMSTKCLLALCDTKASGSEDISGVPLVLFRDGLSSPHVDLFGFLKG
ncbi:hypothetical protein TNCV_947471 [Trichonephila clavipes]|nr:hypothetical protein TNCV_947471 [Trichonephila clavipes]